MRNDPAKERVESRYLTYLMLMKLEPWRLVNDVNLSPPFGVSKTSGGSSQLTYFRIASCVRTTRSFLERDFHLPAES